MSCRAMRTRGRIRLKQTKPRRAYARKLKQTVQELLGAAQHVFLFGNSPIRALIHIRQGKNRQNIVGTLSRTSSKVVSYESNRSQPLDLAFASRGRPPQPNYWEPPVRPWPARFHATSVTS